MSNVAGMYRHPGKYRAEEEGFKWNWGRWLPEKNFSDLLLHNREAAIKEYQKNAEEWDAEYKAGDQFERTYKLLHPHAASYLQHPHQLHHSNQTWTQVIGRALGQLWPFGTHTPANAAGSPAYGHNIYGFSNGTVPYGRPEIAHGGPTTMMWPYVAGGLFLGAAGYCAYNHYRGGAGASPPAGDPPGPHFLELGEGQRFLPAAAPTPLPAAALSHSAWAPSLHWQSAPLRRSQSALF
jgi:hypothetical protein